MIVQAEYTEKTYLQNAHLGQEQNKIHIITKNTTANEPKNTNKNTEEHIYNTPWVGGSDQKVTKVPKAKGI